MHSIIHKYLDKYRKMPVQLKASFWFVICSFLQRGISVISMPIFTRLMNTSEYGKFTTFNSWLSILTVFVTLNLTAGVFTQGLVKFYEDRDKFCSSLQGLSLTLTLIWTVVYIAFKQFWNNLFNLTTVQMLAMLVMMWSSSVFNFWSCEQRVEYRYKKLVIITLLVSILKPLIGILFVIKAEDKTTARILGLALVELICYMAFFFIQMYKGKVFYSKYYWSYSLKYNIPLLPHYLSQSVLSGADKIMIDNMCGASYAGIYGLAVSISSVMTLFNTALMQTLSPWIYQKIKNKRVKDISSIAYIALGFIGAVNILLIAFAPEIVSMFAPVEYYEAIYVIPPVAMGTYFMFSYDLFAKFEFYYEKTKGISIATTMSALLNIILNYFLIKKFGYMAAGYTTLLCYVLYALFHYLMMKKISNKYLNNIEIYDDKTLVLITLLFILIGFMFMALYNNAITRYVILILLIIVILLKKDLLTKLIELKIRK